MAVCLGLGLNEAAYMAEIARAGILSVDEGQVEAASALGMTRLQAMRRIVLPQAMRVIIPPTGNETISMLKTSSLASVIGYLELLYAVQTIYARTYQTIPLLIVASLWYLFMTSILTIGQYYVERRYARGALRELPPTPLAEAADRSRSFGSPARLVRWPPVTTTVAPMVQAQGVRKSFGHLEVLKGIDLEVAPRDVFCLIGPSGSGKSTFLRCINHLEKINVGPALGRRRAGRATASRATSSTSCATRRSAGSARRSAWSSSTSTSSRT